ncbi:MAG: ATP-dependent helicase [Anaerolineae bacterium]
MSEVRFRPEQAEILAYTGGLLGIAAVPGSGKTFTLAHLAARLVERIIASGDLASMEREVLIVTFTNSAVESIRARIANILQARRTLLAQVGYRVRTLHGLAHDIVRERPSLVGLAEDFAIVDERIADQMIEDTVNSWLRGHGTAIFDSLIDAEVLSNDQRLLKLRRDDLPDLARSIARNIIRQAKDRRLPPRDLAERLGRLPDGALPLARFGVEVYSAYQRALAYRGAVDFDDLVRLSLKALDEDPSYLARLQRRFPYILEDEAQDSSALQNEMLGRLSHLQNWVRVGDPNQAINTTFTTADPRYLSEFLDAPNVQPKHLSVAGRSALPIIALANDLVDWTVNEHPVPELRSAFRAQQIQPTQPDDAQPNPPADQALVFLNYKPNEQPTPDDEIRMVADSIARWLPQNGHLTVAALVPENAHGFRLAEALRQRGVDYEELLRSTSATRESARKLHAVLSYLNSPIAPNSGEKLARLYDELWWFEHLGRASTTEIPNINQWHEAALREIEKCQLEDFLFPVADKTPLNALKLPSDESLEPLYEDLTEFSAWVARWVKAAAYLPIDQLVLTIGQDIFKTPPEIALGFKIAQMLRSFALEDQQARLGEFVAELSRISQNERRFLGFEDAETGYAPKPGKVTIATMHAAKGLEWDRVYLLSVNSYSFPSAQADERLLDEKWFARDGLNIAAEAQAQLESLIHGNGYLEGAAGHQFRLDYAAERLRLLYVGITRARRELIVTWNTGRFHQREAQKPSLPLVALSERTPSK